jgi:hypothetical protein
MPRGTNYIQRLPMEVTFHNPLVADQTIPFEARREAYAKLVSETESAVAG